MGRARAAVLDRQGRAGYMMAKADPTDVARLGAVLPAVAPPRISDLLRNIAHRGFIGAPDGLADRGGLGRARGELGRKGDGFMRREGEVVAADLALVLGPGRAGVGPLALEQAIELLVLRRAVGIKAEGLRDGGGHVLPPDRAGIARRVIAGEAGRRDRVGGRRRRWPVRWSRRGWFR